MRGVTPQTPYVPGPVRPEEPFTLQQMAPPKRRRWLPAVVAGIVLALVGGGYATYALTSSAETPAQVIDGVPAPDPKCIHDVQDLSHPWITDGWWAGRVDGQVREMSSQAAMAQSLSGSKLEGVWLCPPKRDW